LGTAGCWVRLAFAPQLETLSYARRIGQSLLPQMTDAARLC